MTGCIVTLRNGETMQLGMSASRVKHMRRAGGVLPLVEDIELPFWRKVLVRLRILRDRRKAALIPASDVKTITSLALDEFAGVE